MVIDKNKLQLNSMLNGIDVYIGARVCVMSRRIRIDN